MNQQGQPELLTRQEVAQLTRLSKSSVERYIRQNRFPKPIDLGPNRVAWVRSEIDAWISARIAERDREAA